MTTSNENSPRRVFETLTSFNRRTRKRTKVETRQIKKSQRNRKAEVKVEADYSRVGTKAEEAILNDIRSVHYELSPENLAQDGERSNAEILRVGKQLRTRLEELITELGYFPNDKEIYREWLS